MVQQKKLTVSTWRSPFDKSEEGRKMKNNSDTVAVCVNFDHLKKNSHTKLVEAEILYTCTQDQRKITFLMLF